MNLQSFSRKWDEQDDDYGGEIEVLSNKVVYMEMLRFLRGCSADPHEAWMLAVIGAPNVCLDLPSSKKEEYKSIAREVSGSSDVLMLITPVADEVSSFSHEESISSSFVAFHLP